MQLTYVGTWQPPNLHLAQDNTPRLWDQKHTFGTWVAIRWCISVSLMHRPGGRWAVGLLINDGRFPSGAPSSLRRVLKGMRLNSEKTWANEELAGGSKFQIWKLKQCAEMGTQDHFVVWNWRGLIQWTILLEKEGWFLRPYCFFGANTSVYSLKTW